MTPRATRTESNSVNIPEHHTVAIAAASRQLAAAEREHARALKSLTAAIGERNKRAGRVDVLHGEREAVVARRQAGDRQPNDAAQLLLLEADREGMNALLAEAEEAVAVAQAPVNASMQAMSTARQLLDQAVAAAEEEALLAHAVVLDGLMLETVQRLERLRAGAGQPKWGPSAELRAALRRLSSMRGEL